MSMTGSFLTASLCFSYDCHWSWPPGYIRDFRRDAASYREFALRNDCRRHPASEKSISWNTSGLMPGYSLIHSGAGADFYAENIRLYEGRYIFDLAGPGVLIKGISLLIQVCWMSRMPLLPVQWHTCWESTLMISLCNEWFQRNTKALRYTGPKKRHYLYRRLRTSSKGNWSHYWLCEEL